ncbi:hypothetical protein GALMADRAFT_253096 [Galerina marginata CBS 339.88]|uniref:DUF6534 domain-containing protein n=1 Tax=Galerina marginata (strain CBS 339.88) TaxID=685588 RepID=A0A067SMV7_GALM3|nr:hypothetical protein GALMADRAFT_253096 [Galerina marginata CBS 339.88]
MPPSPLTPAELGRIAGPLLIGYILNWGLFGVLSMQVYVYYLAFPKDRAPFKALVCGAYLLEATQTFLFTTSAFRTFAFGFGNPAILNEVDILWFSVSIMGGMVAFVAQSFYAYRIMVLSSSKIVAGLIMLLACFSLAGAIAIGVQTKNAVLFSNLPGRSSFITAGIWEGGSAACDVLIAVSMTYYLNRYDSQVKQTKALVRKITRLTIETGALTAAVAILTLILTFLPGHPTYYQTTISVLGKLYSNSMMASFNSRANLGSSESTSSGTFELPIVSQGSRMHSDMDTDLRSRTMHGGVLMTREEVTFTSTSKISKEQKSNMDDVYHIAS